MVTAYLELLERKYGDELDDDAKQYMRFAVDGAMRMRELIRDLLAYSRVESGGGEFTDVDMNDALSTSLSNLSSSITANSAIVKAEHLSTVTADRTQMTQLFQNLVGNAIKYHDKEPPTILVSCADGPGYWTFSVKDNGIGIAPDQFDRIFQMFSRLHTREEYEGTGIGLAIAKRIVERHGGGIWVESTPGMGSEFFFSIPKRAAQAMEHGLRETERCSVVCADGGDQHRIQ
jgi:light-regulated signal transduction histidine kinase (bacteriophytochrome)